MKIRKGFVSNSSSTSFVITNTSEREKTLVDFVKENPQLVKEFLEYGYSGEEDEGYTQGNMIKSAKSEYPTTFKPSESKILTFGDEDGTVLGCVFDYILREGGESKSFKWKFHEMRR